MNLKLCTLLFLVVLFCMDDVDAWRRRRRRIRIRVRVRRVLKKVGEAKAIITAGKTAVKVLAATGKRSVDEDMPKKGLCDFNLYDLDEDGKADETEVRVMKTMTGLDGLDALFGSVDVNKDGKITPKEFALINCDKAFSNYGRGEKEVLQEKSTQ